MAIHEDHAYDAALFTGGAERGLHRVVARNGFREDVQIRPTVYFGEGGLYAFTPDKIVTGVFITSTPRPCYTLDDEKGVACCVSAWRRIGDNVMPPRVKAGANYHQSRLVNVQAAVRS